jgi:hypothetical protein
MPMSTRRRHRGRLLALGVLGTAIVAFALYRRRQLARNRAEFASRYS